MAEEKVGIKVQVNTNEATESVGSLKKQLREAQAEVGALSDKFGATSKEAIEAAKRAAELKDKIGDAKALTDAFNPDAKFKALTSSLAGVAGAFGAVQGAVGLFGVESKKVEEQLLKVQAAMALSEGLQTLGESVDSFRQLGAVIKTQVVGAFKALKSAIGATGIGLLVVALGTIVAYWDDIKEAVTGVSEEQKKLNKDTEANTKKQQEKLDAMSGQENILKLQGKSEREILQLKVKQTDEVIAATEEQIRQSEITLKAQIEAEKRNKAILKGILDFLVAPSQLVVNLLSKAAKLFGVEFDFNIADFASKFVFDPAKVEEEGNATIAEQRKTLEKLKNDRAGYQLSIQDIDKKAAEDAAAKRKAQQDEELKKEKEFLQKRRDAQLQANAEVAGLSDEIVKKQKDFLADQNNVIKADADAALKAFGASVAERNQKAKELAAADEERSKLAMQREEEKRKAYQMTGEALGALADLVGRQTAAGKALAVSQALINTFLGITEVLRNKTVIPEPFGTIQKIASVTTIAASGFAAVKNILKTQVPGGGGGGANIPSVGSAAPLAPQPATASTTNLSQQSINQLGSATSRAYVLEADVTSGQERIRRINRAARLG